MAAIGPAFFKLKDAKDYRFYNRLGMRIVQMKAGQVITVTAKADVDYFRSRPDVIVETNVDGVPLRDLLKEGHLDPEKARSYRVYGRGKGTAKVAAANPLTPRRPPALEQEPTKASAPVQTRPTRPTPKHEVYSPPAAVPPLNTTAVAARPETMTPIEEVSRDGTTRVVSAPPV